MASLPTKTKSFIVQNSPVTECDLSLGNASSTFKLVEADLPTVQDGQVLIEVIYLSNDPAQRGWMQKDADAARSYMPPVRQGDLVAATGLARVLDSKSDTLKAGDLVLGMVGWRQYGVLPAAGLRKVAAIPGISPSVFVGALGMTGMTAYFGVVEVLKLQKGQSIVVSGAAGAVGNIVVQYAKHIVGASKVVAIAGSDEKCALMKKLGADIALNYKASDFKQQLDTATDGFVDAYFDNVGGEILDQMLTRLKRNGRIAACGAISGYNSNEPTRLAHYGEIIKNRITLQGFIVLDFLPQFGQGIADLSAALKTGKIDLSNAETLVEAQFEEIPSVWGRLFVGGNTGKLVTQIAKI